MKTPAFLLCENPMLTGDHDGRLFILHAREPYILAEVFHFEDIPDMRRIEIESQAGPMYSRLDYFGETIFFSATWLIPGEKLAAMQPQEQVDKLANLMRRMADWYKAYLIWDDEQDHE